MSMKNIYWEAEKTSAGSLPAITKPFSEKNMTFGHNQKNSLIIRTDMEQFRELLSLTKSPVREKEKTAGTQKTIRR